MLYSYRQFGEEQEQGGVCIQKNRPVNLFVLIYVIVYFEKNSLFSCGAIQRACGKYHWHSCQRIASFSRPEGHLRPRLPLPDCQLLRK